MSNSKPLPPFVFDVLCYLNRDQLERFSIICRSLKNIIERYFHTKPYRIFDWLIICGVSYVLRHKYVQWHPNRDDYTVQQFLDGQRCSSVVLKNRYCYRYYSFAEMRPYLGPNILVMSRKWSPYHTYGAMATFPYRISTDNVNELLPKISFLFSIRRQSCSAEI
ncbi:hypothetical protein DdX_19050 [Ditylenchus destructor]|uniref:F-box domain-containing protein n=1 Tax=Ditylenchus destructor TaxID=166010 RepID=A0AAD4MJJ6_9BILA|nr:hypothetical protein DdX_19050 [Ditylenchus destructor]